MNNYNKLTSATESDQAYLLNSPIIGDVAEGNISLDMYVSFLTNAYHHVRFTVPLMMAAGARIDPIKAPLLGKIREYIDEEIGHEQWILNDLSACGADAQQIALSSPNLETEVMIRYVRDYINQVNPIGFFGMVHVLEGTSTSLASTTADLVKQHLHLPDQAFSYLRSHGALDVEHVEFFQELLEDLDEEAMSHVIYVASRVFRLYGNVLRSVPRQTITQPLDRQHVA